MLHPLEMIIPLSVLGLSDIKINAIYLRDNIELIIDVESTVEDTKCRNCGETCEKHGSDREMEIRHLSILGYKTYIRIKPKRGICYKCADKSVSTTQLLEWYERGGRQTKYYEDRLLFELVNSTVKDVSRKEDISNHTIDSILEKRISAEVDFTSIKALDVLGIDEISLLKGRKQYVTIISYRVNGKVHVSTVLKGRTKKIVKTFLESIPLPLRSTITAVCSDLYDGFINAAKEVLGEGIVTADRFHVAKLYRKKLVNIRKSELRRLKKKLSDEQYKSFKEATSILCKGRDYFTEDETVAINILFNHSPKLRLAYQFSRELGGILDRHQSKSVAKIEINDWITRVKKSNLNCFNGFIVTLEKYIEEITNYFTSRNTSGFVEGFNNKIKVLTRRCYGLKSAKRLFQRIRLDTGGLAMFRFSPKEGFAC
jgi:transposase